MDGIEQLQSRYLADLRSSGLSDETIESCGFYSATADEASLILGRNEGPGLIFPYLDRKSETVFQRVKPDSSSFPGGKSPRYLSPKGQGNRLYIPPGAWKAVDDPSAPLIITEGEKKAAKAVQEGFPTVAVSGVWNFRDAEHQFIPDLEEIVWKKRDVRIVFDSDVIGNTSVAGAIWELAWNLNSRGACTKVALLPSAKDGAKQGVDDFLIAGGAEAFSEILKQSTGVEDWAFRWAGSYPSERRNEAIKVLCRWLTSLDAVKSEILVGEHSKELGLRKTRFRKLVEEAQPWKPSRPRRELENEAVRAKAAKDASENSKMSEYHRIRDEYLADPFLLHRAIHRVEDLGVVGERKNIGLIRLAVRSRVLDRPINLEVNSPSSAGKTFIVTTTLKLEHEKACYELTAHSEKSLVFLEEGSLKHRTIFIQEPEGIAEGAGAAIFKSLTWEGRVKYDVTVQKDGEYGVQRIEQDGPTGLIVNTTRSLGEQMSNRMLRIEVDDSKEQTRRVLVQIARDAAGQFIQQDLQDWREVSEILGEPVRVRIPFSEVIADKVSVDALRVRRHFTHLLTLIKTSAVEFRYQRKGTDGLLTATLSDYANAHALVSNVFESAQDEGITQSDREMVAAIAAISVGASSSESPRPVSQVQIVSHTGLSKGPVSYRVRRLLRLGYLSNLEEKVGRPHKIVIGEPLPEQTAPLPDPCEMAELLALSGQHQLIRPWINPITGEWHNCVDHLKKDLLTGDETPETPKQCPRCQSAIVPEERQQSDRNTTDTPARQQADDGTGVLAVFDRGSGSEDAEMRAWEEVFDGTSFGVSGVRGPGDEKNREEFEL